MRLCHSGRGSSMRAGRNRFLHEPSTSLGQWSQAATRQIPQAFVSVARVNENNAFACGRVIKCGARMFRDKLKERLPPRSIRIIKHLFSKLLQFVDADYSDRFIDGFSPLIVDSVSVLKFTEWHGLLIL